MSFNLYPVASDTITTQSITDMTIVLDLDATLICTQESMDDFKSLKIMTDPNLLHIKRKCYCIKIKDTQSQYGFWGSRRDHLETFLLFCFNYFKYVVVWSAGTKEYVLHIVADIFKNLRPPHFIWSKNDCEWEGADGTTTVKPLTKLINSEFGRKHNLKLEKIIHLDDNDTTYKYNKKNACNIPEYEPSPTIEDLEKVDTALLQFKYWLLLPHVMYSDDVTKLDMTSVFKHSAEDYKNVANTYYQDIN